jgi:hypothetical protein
VVLSPQHGKAGHHNNAALLGGRDQKFHCDLPNARPLSTAWITSRRNGVHFPRGRGTPAPPTAWVHPRGRGRHFSCGGDSLGPGSIPRAGGDAAPCHSKVPMTRGPSPRAGGDAAPVMTRFGLPPGPSPRGRGRLYASTYCYHLRCQTTRRMSVVTNAKRERRRDPPIRGGGRTQRQ